MIRFGFCDLAVVPVRTDPSDKAEMSTQLLFGDIVEVTGQSGVWSHVKNYYDAYEGWIDTKQLLEIDEDEFQRLCHSPLYVNRQMYSDTVIHKGKTIRLPAGCSFYDLKGQVLKIGDLEFNLKGQAYPFVYSGPDELLKTALTYLSCPYLWGGKTYIGLDCSGLTQLVYKKHGISLFRDAAQQATQGEMINFISDALPGDLAFFDNEDGKIIHVGILLNDQQILHCSGEVRLDTIDHQGIFNKELNKYSHSLRLIRRLAVAKM